MTATERLRGAITTAEDAFPAITTEAPVIIGTRDARWLLELAESADRLRELPDGVELRRDGTLWALGRNIPDGWERNVGGRWVTFRFGPFPDDWYEVRPPQEPPTVRVPWWEALGRVLVVDGRPIVGSIRANSGDPVRLYNPQGGYITGPDADGTVEVLA